MNWFHPLRPVFMALLNIADAARAWRGDPGLLRAVERPRLPIRITVDVAPFVEATTTSASAAEALAAALERHKGSATA